MFILLNLLILVFYLCQEIFPGGIQGVILFGVQGLFLGNLMSLKFPGVVQNLPPRFVYLLSLLLSNIGLQDAKGF